MKQRKLKQQNKLNILNIINKEINEYKNFANIEDYKHFLYALRKGVYKNNFKYLHLNIGDYKIFVEFGKYYQKFDIYFFVGDNNNNNNNNNNVKIIKNEYHEQGINNLLIAARTELLPQYSNNKIYY